MIEIEKFLSWVDIHRNERPEKLRLRFHGKDVPSWIVEAINHIESYQKSFSKFITTDNKSHIPTLLLPELSVEQSTSASVAELHARLLISHLGEGRTNVLDMTCGLGTDSRMLSENNLTVTALEKDKYRFEIAKINFSNFDNVKVINEDCREFIKYAGHYDAVIIDPARRSSCGGRLYNVHDCEPDVTLLVEDLRKITDYAMVKLSPMLDITETLRELPRCSVLNVIGNRNECVELLAELDFMVKEGAISDKSIRIYQNPSDSNPFNYTIKEVLTATPLDYMDLEEDSFVYIPSATTMKAGCFNLISARYNIHQVSANTHIFSNRKRIDFPLGKTYKALKKYPFSSSVIKRFQRDIPRADVFVKNFGLSANELSTRLKLKPSDETRILGYRDKDGSKKLAVLVSC